MTVAQSTAYATVESVNNLARAIVNDMLVTQGGEILTDTAPFTFVMLNSAARYFNRKLSTNGVKTFEIETILTPVPACNFPNLGLGGADPGQQVVISDVGYFDGSSQHYPPQIPPYLLVPITLHERITGSQERWVKMTEYPQGLPSIVQGPRLGAWEWRSDGLWMPGATQTNDIKMRFWSDVVQFATPNDSIMIRGAIDPIGNYLAALFVNSRNPQAAAAFSAAGDDFTMQIVSENVRAAQSVTRTRFSYGLGASSGGRI